MKPSGIVTLITDFGTDDAYVGMMKGALLAVNPKAVIIDVSHAVGAQDVREAAWLLRTSFRHFPPGTVHVAVVDPGVGAERRGIAVEAAGWYFVAPDNGVLSWALHGVARAMAVTLDRPRYFRREVSATFHGRDIFAPIAGYLSRGTALRELGTGITDPGLLPFPALEVEPRRIVACVMRVDRFGNLMANLDFARFESWHAGMDVVIEAGATRISGLARTYADAPLGEAAALFGSSGYLEIAVRDGSASEALRIGRGDTITLTLE